MLNAAAAAVLGVSLGAMLAGGVLLVPFWREIAPAEILAGFAAIAFAAALLAVSRREG